jgi:dihydrofolate reductase
MATIYYTASSLDGFIADAKSQLDWLLQMHPPDDLGFEEFYAGIGAIAMGSTTYQWILDHNSGADSAEPWPYRVPAWVFTSRPLSAVAGAEIHFVRGDTRPVHREMEKAAGERDIWLVGGGELAAQFYDHGLLDRIIVTVASLTLGSGSPLFPRRTAPRLLLRKVKQHGDQFAELWYDVLAPSPPDLSNAVMWERPAFRAPGA